MKNLIVTNGYPSNEDLYRNGFVHRRVKEYLNSSNMEFQVFVLDIKENFIRSYIFDGVQVIKGNNNALINYLKSYGPDKILIHFISVPMMNAIRAAKYENEIFIWIHGVEGLGWYRRLFNINYKDFHKYIIYNTIQRRKLKEFILEFQKQIHFIFVSKWMKDIFSKDVFKVEKNYSLIPNIIDSNIFGFSEKKSELRKKVLLIRPFSSKKYANDIAVDAIKILSKNKLFNEFEFTIVGSGVYFSKLTESIKHYPNITLINQFLTQEEIAKKHSEHGIFLCPTRQDSQGVSMCEAMSSGLVPITSNNTAIPEFVIHEKSGFLTNCPKEITEKLLELYEKPEKFKEMSKLASEQMVIKCSAEGTINKELSLIDRGKNI